MALRRLAVLLAALSLVVAACAPNETPEPSLAAEATPTPGPIAEATPTPAPSEPTVTVEAPRSSEDLIKADVASGKLDAATGYQYRFYAQYADPRLPEQYQGDGAPDHDLADAASLAVDGMSADDQARLRPFLLRPTDPASYFQDPAAFGEDAPAARAGRVSDGVVAARNPVVAATHDPRCRPGKFIRKDVPQYPVTVWSVCSEDAAGNWVVDQKVEERANKVVAFMTDLYPRMKAIMGAPIGDAFASPGGAGEVTEAGDGRIDIYVLVAISEPYHSSRVLEVKHLGQTYRAAPKTGSRSSTSSGYIVINWATSGPSDARRKANVAHEFFHVLQNAHNNAGKYACAYPSLADGCTNNSHWFTEASAAWAEHYFVPEDDGREPDYERFDHFLTTRRSLSDNAGTNAYQSWVWPLFMQQEGAGTPDLITATWEKLEGKAGWREFQAAVNDVLPFDTHFRDFAVRVWNHELDWAPPPLKRFHELDPLFRDTAPDSEDYLKQFLEVNGLPANDPVPRFGGLIDLPISRNTVTVTEPGIPELWAEYYDISPTSDVRGLTFVFSGLTPQPQLDVDMLLRINDKWERRKYAGGTIQFCLDKPADAIQQIILVLSNHEMRPQMPIRGTWTVSPSAIGCLTSVDTIVYTSVYEQGAEGSDYYRIEKETFTVILNLKSGFGGNENAISLVNEASTWHGSYEFKQVIKGLPNCDLVSESSGGGGGAIQGEDGASFGAGVQDDGTWTAAVTAYAEYRLTGSTSSCAGSYPDEGIRRVDLPFCEGVEIKNSSPRTFNFQCSHTGEWTWSITGKVRVNP